MFQSEGANGPYTVAALRMTLQTDIPKKMLGSVLNGPPRSGQVAPEFRRSATGLKAHHECSEFQLHFDLSFFLSQRPVGSATEVSNASDG